MVKSLQIAGTTVPTKENTLMKQLHTNCIEKKKIVLLRCGAVKSI